MKASAILSAIKHSVFPSRLPVGRVEEPIHKIGKETGPPVELTAGEQAVATEVKKHYRELAEGSQSIPDSGERTAI